MELDEDNWRDSFELACEGAGHDPDCLTLVVITRTDDDRSIPTPRPHSQDDEGRTVYKDEDSEQLYSPCLVASIDPDPELVDEVPVPTKVTVEVECVPLAAEDDESAEGG